MKTTIILSVILFSLVGAKCSNADIGDNVPKDFRVILRDGGGMARQGATYFISRDSSFADIMDNDANSKVYFKVSMDQLKSLYNIILQNSFHAIETYEEMVYDRGGTTIDVRADGESYQISNSGMTFIKENWRNEWQAVEDEIRSIISSELDRASEDVVLNIDESVMDENKIVNFNIGSFVFMSARDGYQKTFSVRLYPGEHYMYVTMLNKDLSTEPGSKIFAQGQGVMKIDKDTKSILVYREGEKIMWK
jgi:hypothetical protein